MFEINVLGWWGEDFFEKNAFSFELFKNVPIYIVSDGAHDLNF